MIGIGGTDIAVGHKKLTVAVVWQLMHYHLSKLMGALYTQRTGGRRTCSWECNALKRYRVSTNSYACDVMDG